MNLQEIKKVPRKELIAYLESWGFQCYAHETTGDLRKAAIENFRTESKDNRRKTRAYLAAKGR